DAQGGLGFVNTYTENTYKTATLNKTDHFAFLKGYPGGGFAPGKNMSRAEVTTMFARLLTEQMEANKSYPVSFSDVTSAHWAANYIGYMEQFGIVRGYSDGTFRPNAPITRAEFAAICCRFEQLTDGAATFTDVPASHWAAKSIAYAAKRGWVTGYADGTFKPGNNITRAEVAAVTCRLLERSADEAYIRAHLKEMPRVFADMNEQHWAYWYAMEAANGHDYTRSGNAETWLRTYP
ncbi:MAG: S-layer homology domain-containing protein, partial [Clostridiales bacterium]|nr:S-layer homology domain-containing protein [Clostridiales bacterium]